MDITNEEYLAKARGQLRLQLNGVMETFNCLGLQIFVPGAIDAIMDLANQYHERLCGKDTPILTAYRMPRPTDD